MSDSNTPNGRSGRPTPSWLQSLGATLAEKVQARGMTLSRDGAEAAVAEHIQVIADRRHITERAARAYFDQDALDVMADSFVESAAGDEPDGDLLALPRTGGLTVPGMERIAASLAQCHQFFATYDAGEGDLSRARHEIAELSSMLNRVQSEHNAGNTIWAPRALLVRISRALEGVARLTSDPALRDSLRSDAFIAKAGSKLHRWRSESAAVVEAAGHAILAERDVDHVHPDWNSVAAKLDQYPWVVWQLTLIDPDRLAGEDVAERTRNLAEEAADLYGCVYVGCVDDDEFSDGVKYYQWLIEVKQSEHRTPVRYRPEPADDEDRIPQVVYEVCGRLCTALPEALHDRHLWRPVRTSG